MLCQASCCSLGNRTLFLRIWRSHHVRLSLMKNFVFRNWGRLSRSWKLRGKIWKQLWATAERNYKLWNWKIRYKQLINSIHWHFSNFRRKSSALLRFWLQNKFSLKELRWRLIYFFELSHKLQVYAVEPFRDSSITFNFNIILLHWGNIWKKRYSETYRFVFSRFPWRPLFHDLRVTFEENFKKCEPNLRIYSYGHCFAHWKPLLNSLLASIAFVDHKFQTKVHESDISCVTSKLKFA